MRKRFSFRIVAGTMILAIIFCLASCVNNRQICFHNDRELIIDVEGRLATCQQTGLESGKMCLACGKMIGTQRSIPKTNCFSFELMSNKTFCLDSRANSCVCSNVIIPETYKGIAVTSIGTHAFMNDNFTNITIPGSIKTIDDYAFSMCRSLKTVVIPEGVQNIGNYCFKDCKSLESVYIPDSVKSIDHAAFWGCENLKTITFTKSIKTLNIATFYKCKSLTSINFEGTVNEWKNIKKLYDINYSWDTSTGNYTVYCIDGRISKDGKVTYYN